MTNQQNQQNQQQPRPQQNPQPQRERRAETIPQAQMLTTSIPVALLRAGMAALAAWGAFTIAIEWSAYWTLVFAADISGYIEAITRQNVWNAPTVAYALVVVITVAPALLMGYAALPTTPLLSARIALGLSFTMSAYDILTTFLGYDVMGRIQAEATTWMGVLTAAGIFMTSVLASFADEAGIVFLSMFFAYAYEAWLRWKGEEITFFRSYTALPTLSGLVRVVYGDNPVARN